MKNAKLSLEQLNAPKKAAPAKVKPTPAKRKTKPTAWGQGVLKKLDEFRLALALEK